MMLPPTTVEMFECLLEDMAERLATCPLVEHVTPDTVTLFLVTTSWLETSVRYGEAIRVLLADKKQGAVGPLERALWEMWINWKYLLNHTADSERAAQKVLLTAKIEALDFLKKHDEATPSTIDSLQRGLDAYAAVFKDANAEVLKQRKGRPVGWSGISHSKMEQIVSAGSVLYKVLSWDTHSTIVTLRDIRITIEGDKGMISFGRSDDDPVSNPARVAFLTTEVLYDMFEDWRELWKLPPLHASRERGEA